MRQITSHKINGLNENLDILATDEPGAGGANHAYDIHLLSAPDVQPGITAKHATRTQINFQNGPIAESGVNGISNESLLAVVIDRLQCFQSGEYRCRENAIALTHLEDAMHWLQHRTRERLARGVEGTSQK